MSCGGRALLMVCLALALLTLPAAALTVTVESAGATQVVSGIATVSATGVGAGNYILIRANGKFVAAVAEPFAYEWDSRAYEDGAVTLQVSEVGASGPVGTPFATEVLVTNSVTVQTPVTLQWGVKAGDSLKTTIEGTCDLYDGVREDLRHKYVPGRLFRVLAGTITGSATDAVSAVANGKVSVDRSLEKLTVDQTNQVTELAGSGRKTLFALLPSGRIEDPTDPGVMQARVAMPWIALPSGPVDVRGTWTGDLVALESAQTGSVRLVKDATYELLGFRMWEGEKCALVEARARYADDLVVKLSGADERFPRASAIVRRLVYFSLDTGRVIRSEDTVERWFSVSTEEWGVGAEDSADESAAAAGGSGAAGSAGKGSAPMLGATRGSGGPTSPMMGGMGAMAGAQPTGDEEKVPANVDLVYSVRTVVSLVK